MGALFRPKEGLDFGTDNRKIIENTVKVVQIPKITSSNY